MNLTFSFIIPVYNRPDELEELLESLSGQTYRSFEVIVVEDGSENRSDSVVDRFRGRMALNYIDLSRSGPSVARNAGMEAARGAYMLFVDSDCLLPADYLDKVFKYIQNTPLELFGGPDRASVDFTRLQKAISYAMTSFLTTGGIRGGKKQVDRFYPRSFNMGISRKVFERIGGFPVTRMHPGEDMVFSIEVMQRGFQSGLIQDAFVYHKRRTSFEKFFRQVSRFGQTRYIISTVYPETFKIFFVFPSLFLLGSVSFAILAIVFTGWFLAPLALWAVLIGIDSSIRNRDLRIGLMSVWASSIQMYGYGGGFLTEWVKRIVMRRDEYGVYSKGFYTDSIR